MLLSVVMLLISECVHVPIVKCLEITCFCMCLDINECDVLNGGCSHYCNNTDGSYYCSCPVGYDLVNELLCEGKHS